MIPFCDFGGNMSAMGVKIDQFDDPVCNSFQAKIQNDQLCYEVDLHQYATEKNFNKALKSGFRFILDYNEDRVVSKVDGNQFTKKTDSGFFDKFNSDAEENQDNHVLIYLDTIGENEDIDLLCRYLTLTTLNDLEPIMFVGDSPEGAYEYNLDAWTVVEVTDSFLGLDQEDRGCQLEPLLDCTTRQYQDALLSQCGCLPLNIRLSDEVKLGHPFI